MRTSEQQTSSIGAAWPPSITSNERLRGFYVNDVITGAQSASTLEAHLCSAVDQLEGDNGFSRISIRVVAELGSLSRLNFEATTIEAVLPIAASGLGVVYLGANEPERRLDNERLDCHVRLLNAAVRRVRSCRSQNLDVKIVDHNEAEALAGAFMPLYEPFGYGHHETESLLADRANIIAYATMDGQVVSTAMAEQGTVMIDGYGELALVEITEASTHPLYRQRGLYAAVSSYLTEQLVGLQRQGERTIDVIYGESNLAMPGVVHAAHQNGRKFSFFDRETLGVSNCAFGILPQNFKVSDGVETRAYNDLAVSYVPL